VSLLAGRKAYYFRVNCEASILQYIKRAKNAALFFKTQLLNWQLWWWLQPDGWYLLSTQNYTFRNSKVRQRG